MGGRAGVWFAVALTSAAASSDARAQHGRFASAFLPAGHWSVEAVRKLDALGLAPRGFDAGMRSVRIGEVAWVLEHATAASDAAERSLARGYQQRFAEEFGAWADAAARRAPVEAGVGTQPAAPTPDGAGAGVAGQSGPDRSWLAGGSIGAGYERRQGWVLGGVGYSNVDDWTGPFPDEDVSSARASAFAAVSGRVLALGATPHARSGETRLLEAQAVLELGRLGLWGGRRAHGYGPAAGGGIVLSGAVALDGGGIFLTGPVRLPWILHHLGELRADMFLSRVSNGDIIRDPWFWGARVSLEPSSRLRLGVNRGAMFGGEGNSSITLDKLWLTFRGEHAGEQGEFANQVLSVDARYRLPVGVPLAAYIEWGMDDLSGGYWRAPAFIAGLELAGLPGLPQASIGVERTSFAAASYKNTIWYRNWAMRGGWTDAGRPLGHALGGHGTEWMAYGRLDLLAARLRLNADVRLRERASENLFAPDRAGDARAGSIGFAWRARPWLDVGMTGQLERGMHDWEASTLATTVRVLF